MKQARFRKLGTLSVIASLLICSAGLRLIGVSSVAIAASGDGTVPAVEPALQPANRDDPGLEALLASIQEREASLDLQDTRLSARSEQLKNAEAAIAEKMNELTAAEARLRDLLAIADSASEDDVARLTTVYENMKPKDAALVFEEMEPAFAAGFLSRMRPDAAASVMAGLEAKTAYAISVVLAGRHAEFQTE
ncbi:MAG: hypothetical protein WBC85_04670 [Planktotalea sp.]|uniref:MotE family protein n=1 Tax=Planktotalea sp. TaxID=2029877 RepID=UPI003C78A48C